jgi:(5-formylfuran-3-yl)methyl phosphate synthase
MQRLLVSVRGPKEAIEAARAGAHIADVEYPGSALGTPYPFNIRGVRGALNRHGLNGVKVSTNIGEIQRVRASACQAALGVAESGADLIKFGLAELPLEPAVYLAKKIVDTVCRYAHGRKRLYPAVFVDKDMRRFFDPFTDGPELARRCGADGLLVDTFDKLCGKGLRNYCKPRDIANFVVAMHRMNKEAWIAGSIKLEEMEELWATGVDVICVRSAACANDKGTGRFGKVSKKKVEELVATIPARENP